MYVKTLKLILEKYYNKDIVNTFTSITLFILSIVSVNILIRFFNQTYSHGIGITPILNLVTLTIPGNVSTFVPIGIFLSIILTFGKYFSNNEMLVTLSAGVTWNQIVQWTLKPTIVIALATFLTNMYLAPFSMRTMDIYRSSLAAKVIIRSIAEKKIIKVDDEIIFYVDDRDQLELKNIFLYKKHNSDDKYRILIAPKEKIEYRGLDVYLNFIDLKIYTADSKTNAVTYGKAKKGVYIIYDNSERNYNHAMKNRYYLGELIALSLKGKKFASAEIVNRINNSINVIIAVLLALSLCRLQPNQNKYAKLFPSMLVLTIYIFINMLTNSYIIKNTIPIWLGILMPHTFFAIFAIKLIRKQNRTS